MKKILFLLVLAMAGSLAWAQAPVKDSVARADSSEVEENVIGGRVMSPKGRGEANVLGAPVYYDINGGVRGGRVASDGRYHRPKHHYLNNLGYYFDSYFVEMEGMFGDDELAMGGSFTYLPDRWGAYGSALVGINHDYLSVGPAVRLSQEGSFIDWHLYGGVMIGQTLGGELGMRWAVPSRKGSFSWSSGSMGLVVVDGRSYLTVGLSLEIAALVSLSSLLLLW